jgi:hypothetical protein
MDSEIDPGKPGQTGASQIMNLDEAQRKKVAGWIAEGLKLSEIQNRIASELGLRVTYMEVRLLVDDLKLTPRDAEPPKAAAATLNNSGSPGTTKPAAGSAKPESGKASEPRGISLSVDQLTRPGAVVSGKVTFTDGNKADWYFDQTGRLGLVSEKAGYRPPPADLQQFQAALEAELSKLGF